MNQVQTAETSPLVSGMERAGTGEVTAMRPAGVPDAAAAAGRLRVVHLAKHCGYANGSVHVAVDLACVQAQAGYEVVFASGGGTFVDLLEQHGVRHVLLPQDQSRPVSFAASGLGLWRLCRELRPSVLHAHMMGGAMIGYAASLASGVPLVTTVHNSFDPHSILMRLGHRVVAVSHAERDHLITRGYRPGRVSVVWNAPNRSPRDGFMHNEREVVLAHPCVVAVCALHRRKGVFDLIEACAGLFAEMPEWRLYIAGEGPDRAELEAQAATLGVADRVVFLGFVADPKVLYAQADIFVLASYADPGSLSIGEARGAGCAIVATGVGGTSEMLEHGRAGRLVPPGEPKLLAAAMRGLMREPAGRAALQAASRAGAEVFDVQRLVKDYEAVYLSAIAHPTPARR